MAIVVSNDKDIEKIDFTRRVYLFSQTTMKVSDYSNLAALISTRIKEAGISGDDGLLTVHNTICGQVSNREPRLKEFARNHDIIIFVSGKESSNGKMLHNVCLEENPETYMISAPDELDPSWFSGKFSAGVCGATSTPKWLIDKVAREISALTS
jgi:4-hydroxy-3-methylbut-2-enyl diphosphate reductase